MFAAYIKDNGISKKKLSELSGVSFTTVATAFRDNRISEKSAQGMSNALNVDINKYFTIYDNEKALSSKTIREHHNLISTILSQAEKEMLITFNPARKATPPKLETKEANYFNEDDVERIRDCLEEIPLKWKTIIHLLLISGARRAEIAGLKWDKVDWKTNQVYICNNLLYSREVGIYEDTTKTEESTRWVRLPLETMELLQEYRQLYIKQLLICGNKRENSGFLFVQENGKPMNPNSITDYCKKFS